MKPDKYARNILKVNLLWARDKQISDAWIYFRTKLESEGHGELAPKEEMEDRRFLAITESLDLHLLISCN